MGMCSFLCCSKCCGVLSVLGIFFLFSVGHMFAVQPMFTDVEVWEEHHDHDASVNCYLGGVFYVVTLALSVLCFMYDKKRVQKRPPIAAHGGGGAPGMPSRPTDAGLGVHPVTLAI